MKAMFWGSCYSMPEFSDFRAQVFIGLGELILTSLIKRRFDFLFIINKEFLVIVLKHFSSSDCLWQGLVWGAFKDGKHTRVGDPWMWVTRVSDTGETRESFLILLILLLIQIITSSRNTESPSYYYTKCTGLKARMKTGLQQIIWPNSINKKTIRRRCQKVISSQEGSLCRWDFLPYPVGHSSHKPGTGLWSTLSEENRTYSIQYDCVKDNSNKLTVFTLGVSGMLLPKALIIVTLK